MNLKFNFKRKLTECKQKKNQGLVVRVKRKIGRGLRQLPSDVQKLLFELSIHGEHVSELVDWIRKRYDVEILVEEPGEELVSIESTGYWKEMEKNRIGNLLAGARLKAGLTQAQLADKLGIRQNMVSDYKRGRRRCSDAMAERLSKMLAVNEAHLKYGSEQE